MKATIDVPDDLYRKVKAKTALEGRPIRALTLELFERYLGGELAAQRGTPRAGQERPVVIDGEAAPPWFGRARKYARKVADHSMNAVRESIATGRAHDLAERETGIRRGTKR